MNNGTWIVSLGGDPETITLGKTEDGTPREGRKLRCACNAGGKKAETRWFNAIVTGRDMQTVDEMCQKGTTLALTGQLVKESYKPKKPRYKGEVVYVDTMPFAKIMQVIKGAKDADGGDAADGVTETEAPVLDTGAGDAPTDDLPF
jgi:single-stranded DNA-binding protein